MDMLWRGLVLYGSERLDDAAVAQDLAIERSAADLYPGIATSVRQRIRDGLGPDDP